MKAPSSVQEGCERLLAAYREKGVDPGPELSPGLTDDQIDALTNWFPVRLPEKLRELYRWRNGQPHDAWNTNGVFWFRDMQFSSLERARFEYESMMATYGVENPPSDGIELRTSFPFAAFNGGWYVFPCDRQTRDPEHASPIFCVFQCLDVHFYSMEQMLATCIDWKRESTWTEAEGWDLLEDAEMRIWRSHNPGIFGDAV